MFPPMMMPPMYPPPHYPPPARGGFFRGLINSLLVTVFLASLTLNVYLLLFAGILGFGSDAGNSTVIVDGDLNQEIAVIPIRGVITERTFEKFDRLLRKVEANKNVKALVIDIDTPGGEVTPSDQIYARIIQMKKDKGLPVVVKQGSMATSGGYYISCAGDYIFAEHTTLTANVGVYLQRYNWSELATKYGVKDVTTVATGSTYKYAGSPFLPTNERDEKYFQTICDGMYTRFKQVVKESRGSALKISVDQAADGRALMAEDAKSLGLVDDIGRAENAYKEAATRASLTKMRVVKYDEAPSFLSILGGEAKFAQSPQAQMGGVNFSLDPDVIERLSTPRVMSLWRGQ